MPSAAAEAEQQRLDLQVVWLAVDPHDSNQLTVRRFCAHCQPRNAVSVYVIACRVCGDGPILTGPLAETAAAASGELPQLVTAALTARGWRPTRDGSGWVCCQ